ncbi:hypothetical protein SPONN_943 [uncultured Candidatus Thioglobus sp.]|nr:hypothetical protein SPONN_943 [uncultured Candidatus Thioglobus sp.]
MKIFLLFLLNFTFCTATLAVQGKDLARLAIETKQQGKVIKYAWIDYSSSFKINNFDITNAEGVELMERPQTASSYNGIEYNISNFYQAKKSRMNMVIHYAGIKPGEILSFGFDTGFSAKKININPALFLGYTRAFQMTEDANIAFNVNGWIGGKVSEQACVDEYNRQYCCPTLTAWRDYKQYDNKANLQQNIAFKFNF